MMCVICGLSFSGSAERVASLSGGANHPTQLVSDRRMYSRIVKGALHSRGQVKKTLEESEARENFLFSLLWFSSPHATPSSSYAVFGDVA